MLFSSMHLRPARSLVLLASAVFTVGAHVPQPQSHATIVWSADHETGDLSQWTSNGRGGSYDSGNCIRPANGVSSELSRSGKYSMKMTIDTSIESGCRQFRSQEAISGGTYYYSAWFYLPRAHTARHYWNIVQFKSKTSDKNDPFWVIDLLPRDGDGKLTLRLRWKGTVKGPTATDAIAPQRYEQDITDFPIARWVHVEVYLKQSSDFSGEIAVWQDGKELWKLQHIRTRHAEGDNRWSVNSYSDSLTPSPATIYIDDAVIATERVGPP